MFRKDLIDLLLDHPMSVHQLAETLEERPKDIEDDIRHLIKSLRNLPYRAHITPARCRNCDFHFSKDKLHKPGKCPLCKGTWIEEPLIEINPLKKGKSH
jgi:predicted Zn-ribbon and HTH transcriptional regulator